MRPPERGIVLWRVEQNTDGVAENGAPVMGASSIQSAFNPAGAWYPDDRQTGPDRDYNSVVVLVT
jgi:hypothetical protein